MLTNKTCACLVKAALGAADANLALEEYQTGESEDWKRSWADIQGARGAKGDYVTKYMKERLQIFIDCGGCGMSDCPGCHPSSDNPKGHDTPWQLQSTQSQRAEPAERDARDLGRLYNDTDRAADAIPARDLDAAEEPTVQPAGAPLDLERAELASERQDEADIRENMTANGQEAPRTAADDAEATPAEAIHMEIYGGMGCDICRSPEDPLHVNNGMRDVQWGTEEWCQYG